MKYYTRLRFLHKNRRKSGNLMRKKVSKQKSFHAITKNLNREILTKNLVTFKRWDGVKDEKNLIWCFTVKSYF